MANQTGNAPVIRVHNVSKHFKLQQGVFIRSKPVFVHAVDGVTFDILNGESFGLVGESGCGKTTMGSLIVRLLEPSNGTIHMHDPDVQGFVLRRDDAPLGALALKRAEATKRGITVVDAVPAPHIDPARFKQEARQLVSQSLDDGHNPLESVPLRLQRNGHAFTLERAATLELPEGASAQPDWQRWLERAHALEYTNIAHVEGARLKRFRRRVQMIFQDPYGSLNPRRTIYDIVAEPLVVQKIGTVVEREHQVMEMLDLVGLSPPESFMFRYPHELSGGQRQRVAIARAIIVRPQFVVADEPTSMLDVSIRTGIMKLMGMLKQEFGMSYLYITHDLAVARYMCERIAVMYLGKIVEMGPTEEVLHNPLHPYTKALIAAVPIPDPTFEREPIELKGSISKAIDPPPQCRFYERCPIATERCRTQDHPPLVDHGDGHFAACYEA